MKHPNSGVRIKRHLKKKRGGVEEAALNIQTLSWRHPLANEMHEKMNSRTGRRKTALYYSNDTLNPDFTQNLRDSGSTCFIFRDPKP